MAMHPLRSDTVTFFNPSPPTNIPSLGGDVTTGAGGAPTPEGSPYVPAGAAQNPLIFAAPYTGNANEGAGTETKYEKKDAALNVTCVTVSAGVVATYTNNPNGTDPSNAASFPALLADDEEDDEETSEEAGTGYAKSRKKKRK